MSRAVPDYVRLGAAMHKRQPDGTYKLDKQHTSINAAKRHSRELRDIRIVVRTSMPE